MWSFSTYQQCSILAYLYLASYYAHIYSKSFKWYQILVLLKYILKHTWIYFKGLIRRRSKYFQVLSSFVNHILEIYIYEIMIIINIYHQVMSLNLSLNITKIFSCQVIFNLSQPWSNDIFLPQADLFNTFSFQ